MQLQKRKKDLNLIISESHLKEKLKERNLRLTKARKIILEEVKKARSHPSAYDICVKVRERFPNIGIATVYRNLKLFKELGLIFELEYTGEQGRFDSGSPDHSHFICERCGEVFDLEDPIDKTLEETFEKRIGAKFTHHRVEFYGLCKACRSTKRA